MPTRELTHRQFQGVYDEIIKGNNFVEYADYYEQNRGRYEQTLKEITRLDLPKPCSILEFGGGQMLLLMSRLYGDGGVLADVSSAFADSLDVGDELGFVECDLSHDEVPFRDEFDLVVLAEVVEHMVLPLHEVLAKILPALRPGGLMLITTPNLYRLRNCVRMLTGGHLFCPLVRTERGRGIGHPLELSAENLRVHLELAGYEVVDMRLEQYQNRGASARADLGRRLAYPLQRMRPLWRDNLIAVARRPVG